VSSNRPIELFVSHLFEEDVDYLRVFEFLESVDRFYYINISKPENAPKTGGVVAVKDQYIVQIKAAEAVVILASHYLAHTEMVSYMLDVAEANEKPIIAVRPFGGMDDSPDELIKRASEHVQWSARDMADSIRRQARLEETARWDVLDFP
jgi:hypothetical protein